MSAGQAVARGFDKLGWHWWAADTAVSSVPYDGRPPDTGGFLRSMASTDLNYWPKALTMGAKLMTHARVREILVDATGKATRISQTRPSLPTPVHPPRGPSRGQGVR